MNTLFKVAALAILAAACNVAVDGGNPEEKPIDPKSLKTIVEGSWSTLCQKLGVLGSVRLEYKIEGITFSRSAHSYSDGNCQNTVESKTQGGLLKVSNIRDGKPVRADLDITVGDKNEYDIVGVDRDILFFGTEASKTPEARPTAFNMNLPFFRGGLTATPQPTATPNPIPSNCPNLSGKYLMNTDSIRVKQSDCSKVEWTWQISYYDPTERLDTYIMTGNEHQEPSDATQPDAKIYRRSYWNQDQIVSHVRKVRPSETREYKDLIYFSNRPCNLVNPNATYLTRERYVDGKRVRCDFWAPY